MRAASSFRTAVRLGSGSTAEQVLRGTDLTGTTSLVTGANSGIGAETARVMANAGARVIMTSRDVAAGEAAAAVIRRQGAKGAVVVKRLDLADLRTVRALAEDVQDSEDRLDRLILNAGIMACPLSYTQQGFEIQMGVNHFGHWLLTSMLLDKMRAQASPSRIVSLSSAAEVIAGGIDFEDMHWRHKKYQTWRAYSQSKLANLLMVKELSQRLRGSQVSAYSIHPGVVATNLARHLFSAQLPPWIIPFMPFIKSVQQGAATSVYAATAAELDGQSGAYLDNCKIARPSAAGQDLNLAAKLWLSTGEQIETAMRMQL
ncbi:hypothetical protein WJX74_000397 [Apatococcus lobatus]|uniref:Uncharacterized protein n=1 Tax=Apatococcus lobatus TaxID=904363 RepID=A0AAW1RBU9_9CHLO